MWSFYCSGVNVEQDRLEEANFLKLLKELCFTYYALELLCSTKFSFCSTPFLQSSSTIAPDTIVKWIFCSMSTSPQNSITWHGIYLTLMILCWHYICDILHHHYSSHWSLSPSYLKIMQPSDSQVYSFCTGTMIVKEGR